MQDDRDLVEPVADALDLARPLVPNELAALLESAARIIRQQRARIDELEARIASRDLS